MRTLFALFSCFLVFLHGGNICMEETVDNELNVNLSSSYFLERYGGQLPVKQREAMEALLELPEMTLYNISIVSSSLSVLKDYFETMPKSPLMDGISRDFKWFVENELVSRIEKGVDKTCEKSVDHLHVKDIAFIQVAQLLVDDLFDMIEDTSPVLQGLERHLRVRHDALLKELIPAKKIKVDENPQIPKGATQRFAQPPHHSSEDDDSLEDEDTPYELVLHFEPFKDHKESPEDTILDTLRRTELTADSIDSVLENTALLISLLRNGDYSPDDLDNPVEDFRDFIHSKWKPKRIRGLLKSDFSEKVQQLITLLEPIVGNYYL